jgi:hypothetical protein
MKSSSVRPDFLGVLFIIGCKKIVAKLQALQTTAQRAPAALSIIACLYITNSAVGMLESGATKEEAYLIERPPTNTTPGKSIGSPRAHCLTVSASHHTLPKGG